MTNLGRYLYVLECPVRPFARGLCYGHGHGQGHSLNITAGLLKMEDRQRKDQKEQ